MRKIFAIVGVSALTLVASPVFAQNADAIIGKWYTEKNESTVEISKCNGNEYCVKIIALKEPNYSAESESVKDGKAKAGEAKRDVNNPDASQHNKPVLGMQIASKFKYDAGDNEWQDGEIYSPSKGKLYKAFMRLESPDKIYLKGHLKISKWIGASQYWTRVK